MVGLLVRADILNADTNQTPNDLSSAPPKTGAGGDNATAHPDTATAFVNIGITAEVTEANATAKCTTSGVPRLSTSGRSWGCGSTVRGTTS